MQYFSAQRNGAELLVVYRCFVRRSNVLSLRPTVVKEKKEEGRRKRTVKRSQTVTSLGEKCDLQC